MKRVSVILIILLCLLLFGCAEGTDYDIAATTLPVYDFTSALCSGTDLTVGRLVTESVSCLHDYSLQVSQMRMIEAADAVVISGAGLEDFLEDALTGSQQIIDASSRTHIHNSEHSHSHDGHDDHGHSHETDPHIWLSPENAIIMAENICDGLCSLYPHYSDIFQKNLVALQQELSQLQAYGERELKALSCRELITFHDGFAYLAESFNLTILEAVEEESGSEASAKEIIHLVETVNSHSLPAIFTEANGSDACAGIIHSETGTRIYTLDMAMAGDNYFDAMYRNIDTLKEALG